VRNKIVSVIVAAAGMLSGFATHQLASEPAPVPPPVVDVTPHAVPRPTTEPGVLDQDDFPCHEDEALIFHPRFGPDRVGCVSIEEIRSTTW
jgi:hypothetical protein